MQKEGGGNEQGKREERDKKKTTSCKFQEGGRGKSRRRS